MIKLTPRRTPIQHSVHPKDPRYKVRVYTRGKGKREAKTKRIKSINSKGFNVTLFFMDEPREVLNVDGDSYTQGSKEALESMRTPSIPYRMQLRRNR